MVAAPIAGKRDKTDHRRRSERCTEKPVARYASDQRKRYDGFVRQVMACLDAATARHSLGHHARQGR